MLRPNLDFAWTIQRRLVITTIERIVFMRNEIDQPKSFYSRLYEKAEAD